LEKNLSLICTLMQQQRSSLNLEQSSQSKECLTSLTETTNCTTQSMIQVL
jgi:bind_CPR_0540: carbohydrate ABC transporter substrate-binding protein, CPR_0540 family